ncbi:cytochrome bd oxidase small subunit CydS [Alkalibacillus silvisoli]
MTEFLIYYAPFIVLIASIGLAFWAASRGTQFDEE